VLIIVSREHEGFYQGVKARQESNGRDRVILDRRNGERRRAGAVPRHGERRNGSRRLPLSDAERALMNVLGFTVLDRELQVLPGRRSPKGSPAPAPQAPRRRAAPAKSPRRRAAS
jgi:hypothetical protein